MKVMWLSPEMPFPANTGGRIVAYKRLQYFAKLNDIYFYCIVDNDSDFEYKEELEKYCKEVHLYNRHTFVNKLRTLLNIWRGPLACVSRANDQMKQDMLQCYKDNSIDWVVVEFPQMLGALSDCMFNQNKIILEQHNIEWVTMSNIGKSIKNPLKRLIFEVESKRLKKWEEAYYKKPIALQTFVSSEDKAFFETLYPNAVTYHSPIGSEVDVLDDSMIEAGSIMYFGKMSYPPNAEAAKWFAENVFPGIQKEVPETRFFIVGKDPLPYLNELSQNNPNVIVTGTVDSVREYYEKASVVVVPLSHGGGVKVKVLEALGYGKLVVSTSKGIEGTDFEGGKELLTADSAEEMGNLIIQALTTPEKFRSVRTQGVESINKKYTWAAIISGFENKIHNL